MKTKILNPKIWLIIIALLHLFMGVIGSYMTMGGSIENIAVFPVSYTHLTLPTKA